MDFNIVSMGREREADTQTCAQGKHSDRGRGFQFPLVQLGEHPPHRAVPARNQDAQVGNPPENIDPALCVFPIGGWFASVGFPLVVDCVSGFPIGGWFASTVNVFPIGGWLRQC